MSNKLFVGGLSWDVDDAGLKQAFSPFGQVTEAVVITEHHTGRSRGFGFVTFDNPQDAQLALEEMDGAEIDGRAVNVEEANSK